MQNTPRQCLRQFGELLQRTLFTVLESSAGTLPEKARLLVSVLTLVSPQAYLAPSSGWRGRPARSRQTLADDAPTAGAPALRLAIAQTMRMEQPVIVAPRVHLLARFRGVRQQRLPQRLHVAVIQKTQQGRLIGLSRAMQLPLKHGKQLPAPKPNKRKHQRRPKSAKASEQGTRLERQRKQSLAQQLASSQQCSIGVKTSSQKPPAILARL